MGTENSSYLVTVMSYICWCRNHLTVKPIWIGRGISEGSWLVTVSDCQAQLVLVSAVVTASDCQALLVLASVVASDCQSTVGAGVCYCAASDCQALLVLASNVGGIEESEPASAEQAQWEKIRGVSLALIQVSIAWVEATSVSRRKPTTLAQQSAPTSCDHSNSKYLEQLPHRCYG